MDTFSILKARGKNAHANRTASRSSKKANPSIHKASESFVIHILDGYPKVCLMATFLNITRLIDWILAAKYPLSNSPAQFCETAPIYHQLCQVCLVPIDRIFTSTHCWSPINDHPFSLPDDPHFVARTTSHNRKAAKCRRKKRQDVHGQGGVLQQANGDCSEY